MHHLKRKAMKRDTIIIEDKAVSVTGNDVWMTATEIAGLFHTTVPAVNAAIRAVRKSDVLNDYEVCRYMQLENGLHADVYALEIIIPVAFRVNTYNTHLFRTWLVGKALSQEKRQLSANFFCSSESCISLTTSTASSGRAVVSETTAVIVFFSSSYVTILSLVTAFEIRVTATIPISEVLKLTCFIASVSSFSNSAVVSSFLFIYTLRLL